MMIKKFALVMFLAVMIVVGSQNNQAEAKDIYVGTSDTTGRDCYLMSDTLKVGSTVRNNDREYSFDVKLKMVKSDNDVQYLNYHFWYEGQTVYFSNSQGFSGIVDAHETPIEFNMYDCINEIMGNPGSYS